MTHWNHGVRRSQASLPIRLGLLMVIGICGGSASATVPTYSARLITPHFDAINAAAMNEHGDVVGTTSDGRAWVSRGGAAAILLPLAPGLPYALAYDISDSGVIVGSVNFGYYSWMGFAAAWIPDGADGYEILQYGALPGHRGSVATAVNNLGDVIGHSYDGMFRTPVLFTAPGGIQDLSATGIFDPIDINDQRVLIDHSST